LENKSSESGTDILFTSLKSTYFDASCRPSGRGQNIANNSFRFKDEEGIEQRD